MTRRVATAALITTVTLITAARATPPAGAADEPPSMSDALPEAVQQWYTLLGDVGELGYVLVDATAAIEPCDDPELSAPVYRVTVERGTAGATAADVDAVAAHLTNPAVTPEAPAQVAGSVPGTATWILTVHALGATAGGTTTVMTFTEADPLVTASTTGACATLTDAERELFAVISPWTPAGLDRFRDPAG